MTRVAAIQMEAKVADLNFNIDQASQLIDEAGSKGAEIIALPEFFTTRIVYDERLFECSLPPENPALDMLKAKAAKYGAMIGGSYLEMRDGDVYNTYTLVEPDGTVHRHDKDRPTMVENAFYTGGSDDGHFETSMGPVGTAVCWELIRTATVRRLAGKVGLMMTGSHWWSAPGWNFWKSFERRFHKANGKAMEITPPRFAALVGAPLLHAGHTGMLEGGFLVLPGTRISVPTRTQLMGETQIIDGEGAVVARRHYTEGAGIVGGEIELGATSPKKAPPDRFWIPNLEGFPKALWLHQNPAGASVYRWAKRTGRLKTYDFSRNARP
jgi:predicted amidohydrolase